MRFVPVVEYRKAKLEPERQHPCGKAEEQRGDHHHVMIADVL